MLKHVAPPVDGGVFFVYSRKRYNFAFLSKIYNKYNHVRNYDKEFRRTNRFW